MKLNLFLCLLTSCCLFPTAVLADADDPASGSNETITQEDNDGFPTTPIPETPELISDKSERSELFYATKSDKSYLKSLTKIGRFIYLPKDYDRIDEPPFLTPDTYNYYTTDPDAKVSTIMGNNWFESFYFVIHNVLDIDEDLGIVHLEVRGTYYWVDTRIVIDNTTAADLMSTYGTRHDDQRYLEIPGELLEKLWRPEFFIKDILSSTVPLTGRRDAANLRYYTSGMLKYTQRILVKIPCDFDFQYYPADVQTCQIRVETKGFPSKSRAHFVNFEDDNNDYNLKRIHNSKDGPNKLSVDLIIRRKLTYHLFQTYFLSVFFVTVTWLCVLISPDMVELRIAIALSTLLSLTTMFTSVKDETPKVSYLKAIDIWMVACIMFIFSALAGFTTTAWIKRSLKRLESEDAERQEIEVLVRKSFSGKSDDKKIRLRRRYQYMAIFVERAGVYILSGLFIGFNIIYWSWIFTQSEYFKVHLADQYVDV